jgi:uncharacterized protein (TIGR01777 family)
MKCILTGGSGFIGRHVQKRLQGRLEVEVWNREMTTRPEPDRIDGAEVVIHLAGEPVAQRWNDKVKQRIRDSRVQGTRALAEAMARAKRRPKVFVCASAIGIYGERGDEILTETSAPGKGFLAEVCQEWEAEAARATQFGLRVVRLRIGFVLGKGGGALKKILPAFRMFAGGRLGSGKQWMPWIHVDDVAEMVLRAVEDEAVSGVWNATSPNPARNSDFTSELARAVHRPALIPVPPFALRLAFGELGDHMLDSARVIPQAAMKAGFGFRYPELAQALRDLTS